MTIRLMIALRNPEKRSMIRAGNRGLQRLRNISSSNYSQCMSRHHSNNNAATVNYGCVYDNVNAVTGVRQFSSGRDNDDDDNVGGKEGGNGGGASNNQTISNFLASRQKFLREREKEHHLQSHAKGPGGKSGQQTNKGGGDDGMKKSKDHQLGGGGFRPRPGHKSHFRKGKTIHKHARVRGGDTDVVTSIPTRKGGRGRVGRHKKTRMQTFDDGLLTTFDSDGRTEDRNELEALYRDHLEQDEMDAWLMQNEKEQRFIHENKNNIAPLVFDGPTSFVGFLIANITHPTKYAEVSNEGWHPHDESRREPFPITLSSGRPRKNPSKEFLDQHNAVIYVEKLDFPPGEDTAIIIEALTKRFGTDPSSISLSGKNSAFVGFDSEKKRIAAIRKNHKKLQGVAIKLDVFEAVKSKDTKAKEFSARKDCSYLKITNLPCKYSDDMLKEKILCAFENDLDVDNDGVLVVSPSTALVRLNEKDLASKLISSPPKLQRVVDELHKEKSLHIHKCYREMKQFFGGITGEILQYKPGKRYLLEGEVPAGKFYISHAGVLCLDHVPFWFSKKDISLKFDQYCKYPRDVLGSIQIHTCAKGQPTGRVFVGFDTPEDYDMALTDLSTGEMFLKKTKVKVTPMTDRSDVPLIKRVGFRKHRSLEELHADLTNWEQHVDPEKLEVIEQMYGRERFDQVFRHVRMSNPSYGVLDQAREGERLREDTAPGSAMKEFVQTYVDTMIELYTTPENPGERIAALHMEGEEIDLEYFDGPREYVDVSKFAVLNKKE